MRKIVILIGMLVVLAFILQGESKRLFANASSQKQLGEIIAVCEGWGHFVFKKTNEVDILDYGRLFKRGALKEGKDIFKRDDGEFYQAWIHPKLGRFISLEALPIREAEQAMGKEVCPFLFGEVLESLRDQVSRSEQSGISVLFIEIWREDDYLKVMIINKIPSL